MSATGKKCFTFTWIVENVSYSWHKGNSLQSPTFIVNALQGSKYYLDFEPGWTSKYDTGGNRCAFLYLFRENQTETSINFDCEFALLSKDGSVLASEKKENQTDCSGFYSISRHEVFIAKRSVYLPEDKLTVRCKVWRSNGEMEEDVQMFARSRICIKKEAFVWVLRNFSCIQNVQETTFQIKTISKTEVLMTFDLFLKNPYTDEDLITIQLTPVSDKIKYLFFHLMPLNIFGSSYKGIQKEFAFHEEKMPKSFNLPFSRKNLIANKNKCLPNDVLSFQCECIFSTGDIIEEVDGIIYGETKYNFLSNGTNDLGLYEKNSLSISKRSLFENLKYLFTDSILSDVEVKTSSETFSAHKNILSAWSPVLKAAFINNMKEKYNNCIDIKDFNSDTVRRMLQYFYTAEIEDLPWEEAFELYQAADKYLITSLREECSTLLKSKLSANNACEVLILADLHRDENLKTAVQEFIFNHDVINSEEWKRLMETHVKLAADTMHLHIHRNSIHFPAASDIKPAFTLSTFSSVDNGILKSTTASSSLNASNINKVSAATAFIFNTGRKSSETEKTEKQNVKSPILLGGNSNQKPDTQPFSFTRSSEQKPVTSFFSFGNNRENEFVKSPFVFGHSNDEKASKPSFPFQNSSQKETVESSIAFGNNCKKETMKSSLLPGNSTENEPVKLPFFVFGNSSNKEPAKSSFLPSSNKEEKPVKSTFLLGKSTENEPVKLPFFAFGNSSKKEPAKSSFQLSNSDENEPVKLQFAFYNTNEKEAPKSPFPFLNSSKIKPVKSSIVFDNSSKTEPANSPFLLSNKKEEVSVEPSFSLGNSSENEPVKLNFAFDNNNEKAPKSPFSF